MMPQMTRRDIFRVRREMSRIKPVEMSDPIKAARISPGEPGVTPCLNVRIRVRATTSFAPWEIPRTKGPAIGFAKNVCSR